MTMRHLMLRLLSLTLGLTLGFATTGCKKKSASVVIPPLPKVSVEQVPAPTEATVRVKKGATLQHIADVAYGHEDFSGFVQTLNGIPAPEKLQAGATLKTPSLAVSFREAGLDPQYQPAVNALAMAWIKVTQILPDYVRERDLNGAKDGQRFLLSNDVKQNLLECADAVDAAIHELQNSAPGHQAPSKSINQFASSSYMLRMFAEGRVLSYDYDTFLMEKGFGYGFTYLLIWVQNSHV